MLSLDKVLDAAARFEQQKAVLQLEMAELRTLLTKVEQSVFQFQLKFTKDELGTNNKD